MASYVVYKFGGSSVATPERMRHVMHLIREMPPHTRRVVVISALGGVTDMLLQMIDEALQRSERYVSLLNEVHRRHEAMVKALVPEEEREVLQLELDRRFHALRELLDGVFLLRECTPRSRDAIISMGERLSVPILAAALRGEGLPARALDASTFIRTDDQFGQARVDFETTEALIRQTFEEIPVEEIAVVTGFIGATKEGVLTTLGRSGSDYTATLVGAALEAREVVIWTDVPGVLSADPRLVPSAFPLRKINYSEAAEMAYFGAKVLHAHTMKPVQMRGIPLVTKSTFHPKDPGTLISRETEHLPGHVKAITSIRGMALVTLEGPGMAGVPGIAVRALDAIARRGINVVLVSQASSEQNLCFAIEERAAALARKVLEEEFELERLRGDITGVQVQRRMAIVAAVGENMRMRPGIAGKMFATLGRAGINVVAIAQGSSERNISAVIEEEAVKPAVNALHEVFPRARMPVHVVLVGLGKVGRAFLRQLRRQAAQLEDTRQIHLRLAAVATSRRMYWHPEASLLEEENVLEKLEEQGEPTNLDVLTRHLRDMRVERMLVVDATASEEVARWYVNWLSTRIGVVAANKRANTLELAYYQKLKALARQAPYYYETNVGAGLPIISTLQDLIATGDTIRRIEGVFSGTLAYILHGLREGKTFSEAVRHAHEQGLTEPDPREDLSGEDVARKVLILAREMGLSVERDDVEVTPLLSEEWKELSEAAFWEELPRRDGGWKAQVREARREGEGWQYVGRVDPEQGIQVGLERLPLTHPLSQLQGVENIVMITTDRYAEHPLIVRGPGAGVEVTAAGLFADLLRAATSWCF